MIRHAPTLLLSLALALLPPAVAAADGHAHGHAAPGKLELDAGKKWATDEPLRQSMGAINQAMSGALPLIHRNGLSEGRYRALATTIRQKVAHAVENCKLDPKADAMLHLVIADILAGTDMMEARGGQSRHDGAVKVMQGLEAYGKHFEHPGWRLAKG